MSRLSMTTLSFAVSLLAAAPNAQAQGNPPSPGAPSATASARQVITSAEQLPRRVVKLDKLPSQYLDAPRAEVLALAEALEKNLRDDLAKFDIQDAATMRAYVGSLLGLVQFRGDWAAVPALVERRKSLQDKPGPRALTGTGFYYLNVRLFSRIAQALGKKADADEAAAPSETASSQRTRATRRNVRRGVMRGKTPL